MSETDAKTPNHGGELIDLAVDDYTHNFPPLVASYNHKIRPILDAVDKLRRLNVTQQGIPLPTIVVVGDQSSGKSSVLESLAGISLPRGQDICTRVPLVMRLQHHEDPVPEFRLEFLKKSVEIGDEGKISEAISEATVEVAGNSKGISNVPLTLVVKKKGVPDLTMVDLPGITRVPVGDQPKDIYERISGELEDYENDKQMHCNARLAEMVDKLLNDLQSRVKFSEDFLVEEMEVLEEANGIRLPKFLPRSVFLTLLARRVNNISDLPVCFVNNVCGYLETVCARVLIDRCGNYPQVLPSMRKATQHVMENMKVKFAERVVEMTEMEKITDYTCDPEFIASYNKLMGHRDELSGYMSCGFSYTINEEGYGTIDTSHLKSVSTNTREQALDLKMRITAYWNIVLRRMVDCLALQLRFFMQKMVNDEMETEIVNEVMVRGGGIEKMLDEPPALARKRERLQSSIKLLQESKGIMEHVMDGIVVTSD